ncbi:FAD/NAD(P)-binding protein [Saccharothrix variisporea]|uniref:Putative NAD(P)/FAD-binding protein YdhS n=1 Tax=Saccharothrix variisporea TaxID=543527 RepID=A0A495WZG2_9PSEU|nr:FAD/NAD(P)-binding protein [Saccharothrix variisporea]RKT67251.1 putative NAD(P)/FAD-binding protein YdhS [Saccharothrix variisporea]
MASAPRKVVVVGAGLGGTATAIRLLQFAREPVDVVLVERRPEYRNAGVAYHRAGNHWHHVFNIQAGRMAVFREDVDDFVRWANHEADRTGWPEPWRGREFTESGPAPRRIYPDYLADRLAQAVREATPGATLTQVDGEVVDIEPVDGRSQVTFHDDGQLTADHVVIATGLEKRRPVFAESVVDHPAFVRDPYSHHGIERILALTPEAEVAVVGTLLSAYDSAALLLRRGHTGRIHMISRSGLTLRTYPSDHRHRVLTLPPPELRADHYEGRDTLVRRFRAEWDRACAAVARDHPDVSPVVVTERVAKSWEPHLPEVLRRVPSADLRALLDSYGSLLATLRVNAVAYTTEIVDAAMRDTGQITVTTAKVERVEDAGGRLAVCTSAGTIEADLVISNFGRESDYARVDSPLWSALLRKGMAVPHHRTGRGVEVDEQGTLLGTDGRPAGPLSVIGSPREGDEIVRNGRTGAFTFNLAAIKNHSVGVAAAVLRQLESCYDHHAAPEIPDPEAVRLEVRRMAARTRAEREDLIGQLDTLIPNPAHRCAVNAAATARLNDLSVTPRELRTILGLSATPSGTAEDATPSGRLPA